MSIQTHPATGIPSGFGARLKEERKRLKLSQVELAQIGGVQRLAQLQYEAEATAPTTRYLSAIATAGVDLSYLVLGLRFSDGQLTPEQMLRVEDTAFDMIQRCADSQSEGRLDAMTSKMLFKLFRSLLTQVELGQLPADFDPTEAIVGQVAAIGKK